MKARKRFGQHFLSDTDVLQQIAATVDPQAGEALFEIGPGHGALTDVLLHADLAAYRALELDRDLLPILRARYATQSTQFELLSGDILRTDLSEALAGHEAWRVVGNLPYNISSPLILKLARYSAEIPATGPRLVDCHFMLQREMAQRLAAVPGSKAWGRLSVVAQLSFDIQFVFDVDPASFTPPPQVWSSIVRMRPRQERATVQDTAMLDDVLRRAFSGRRKRLSNALKQLAPDWQEISVDPTERPDNVSAAQFIEIANHLSERT